MQCWHLSYSGNQMLIYTHLICAVCCSFKTEAQLNFIYFWQTHWGSLLEGPFCRLLSPSLCDVAGETAAQKWWGRMPVLTPANHSSRCPMVSLSYLPRMASASLPYGGILAGTLEGACFWEQKAGNSYRPHHLPLEPGGCIDIQTEINTRHCLATYRPSM